MNSERRQDSPNLKGDPVDHSHKKPSQHHHDHCCDHDHSHSPTQAAPMESLRAQANEVVTTFKVANMDCADEIKAIQEALKDQRVLQIQANLMSSTVQIRHTPEIPSDILKQKIETTVVKVLSDQAGAGFVKNQNRNRIILVCLSGLFLSVGLILSGLKIYSQIEILLFLLSIVFGAVLVLPRAYNSLKRFALDMNVLMTVAVIGAVGIQEYAEASAVVFLFSLSELLESLSVQRARRAIQDLLKIAPETADLILENGQTSEIPIADVQISQFIRVKAGESIPVDGVVVQGTSTVNQAPLTGESIPLLKTVGENVFAGTINQQGSLDIRVTQKFGDTKISQVIKLVEEAQSQRAVSQKFVDRFAEIYTPSVLVLALMTFLIPPLFFEGVWHDWLYKSLVLLVIACPCALVISTPVSIVSSLTALAKRGVLVKGGAILEVLGKIKALAVDKTGTLTEGKPKVHQVICLSSSSEHQVLKIAASLEAHSAHPLAQAILKYAEDQKIQIEPVSEFTNVTGRGVEAIISSHHYLLGNHRFAHESGLCAPELEKILAELEQKSFSVMVVGHKPHDGCTGEALAVIALGDSIRPEIKLTLQSIKNVGVEKIIMLSGDHQKTASSVASQVGLSEAYGDLLPADKVRHIEDLKQNFGTVAMIGDGINDAPAMAKSAVGIAMGFVGSDTAIETADVTLMTDDLKQVAVAIKAGQRTLRVIQFNIAFALLTKAIFLILTFAGFSNLWLAVAADTGAALLVIMNSLRLLKTEDTIRV